MSSSNDSIGATPRLGHAQIEDSERPIRVRDAEASEPPAIVTRPEAHILVIDEDEALLSAVAETLRAAGHAPTTVGDAQGLAKLLDASAPDLLLLGLGTRRQDGLSVCRLIRDDNRWQDIPILLLTPNNGFDDRVEAFQAGADDLVAKPIVADELLARIEAQIQAGQVTRRCRVLLQQAENQRDNLLALLDRLP